MQCGVVGRQRRSSHYYRRWSETRTNERSHQANEHTSYLVLDTHRYRWKLHWLTCSVETIGGDDGDWSRNTANPSSTKVMFFVKTTHLLILCDRQQTVEQTGVSRRRRIYQIVLQNVCCWQYKVYHSLRLRLFEMVTNGKYCSASIFWSFDGGNQVVSGLLRWRESGLFEVLQRLVGVT